MLPQAVILAGGKGTRLLALTRDALPKPMVPVAGQPFLYWQLRYLQEQGIARALLLVSHLGHVIQEHFAKNPVPGLDLNFAVEPEPLGTGGALKNACSQLDETFFLINGDSFLHANLPAMARHAADAKWKACLAALTRVELVPVPGNIQLKGHEIVEYRKDAGFPVVDAGVYWLTKDLITAAPSGRFDLESLWRTLIARRELGAFPVTERFFDIGTPERLKQFEEHVHDYF